MKQIAQDLKTGATILEEVPVPVVRAGTVLVKTHCSLVSAGTERMLVEFGRANWFEKARQQPDKVKQVIEKMKSDGIKPTLDAVFRKLGEPLPLGYSNAGEVIAVGAGVDNFAIGDRVVSNGHHAEVVCVPKNLVAKIPESISYEEASFTVLGAIALQGIRLVNPTFGETIVVIGLGLIGQLAAQLLKANGCRVIGIDFDASRVELARGWGIEAIVPAPGADQAKFVFDATGGVGADGVLITASAKTNDVISNAANMSRKRGRIVLVGVVGLDLVRSEFYEKEITFQVSCSYGPGRYDEAYEFKGQDYPLPFVRWTEQRNFEAVLQAIKAGQLQVKPMVSEVADLENCRHIYDHISGTSNIASLIRYSGLVDVRKTNVAVSPAVFTSSKGNLGVVGAGAFAGSTILPALRKLKARMKYIASANGLSGTTLAKKFGIENSTTSYEDILNDPEVDAVLIATRHNQHASQVVKCLQAGKHVFVEKPLALNYAEIDQVAQAQSASGKSVMVGFNRRFSPFIQEAARFCAQAGAINVVATMNAGFIPANHWVHDLQVGGGRIIGEACHLVDLISFLTNSQVTEVVMNAMGENPTANTDNASILLRYANGSQGVINYFANGSKGYSKERVEIYWQQKTIVVDNFRRSHYFGLGASGKSGTQDKGHHEQFSRWMHFLQNGGEPPVAFASILNTSRAVIAAVESLQKGGWQHVE